MSNSSLLIEYQCPQCGAPATLQETDHLFACGYCNVKSYLLSRVFRYMLPHAAPEDKDLIYLPYWRFKGMLFSCVNSGIQHKIVDVSHQGLVSPHFPVSLGLRSQTLKLRFLSPELKGRFLKPSLSYEKVVELIEQRFSKSLPKPIFDQSFIGDTLSIIYAPFYIEQKVYDAVLNRPVSSVLPEDFNPADLPGGAPDWQVKFLPTLCPNCGWDLDGERDSLALNCKNCNSIWHPAKKTFTRVKFAHLAGDGGDGPYLPFWRIKADISGIELKSYADLVRVANLPKVVQESWKDRAFRFWSPAFKVRPQDFMNFSSNLTLFQPEGDLVQEFPEGTIYPVTLSITEAVESLRLNLASFMKPRSTLFPKLSEITIKPKNVSLVYLPFTERGNELSQPAFRLRINKNILSYGRHL